MLARLRHRHFFSLGEPDAAIALLLVDLNQRSFKKLPGCRRSAFEQLDAPALRPLPATRFAIGRWKSATVGIEYHVEIDGHHYSVPHRLVGSQVGIRAVGELLECFALNQRVACHVVSSIRGGSTTAADHMPASHRAHRGWTPAKLVDWAGRIGVSAAAVVTWQLEHRPHPEQGYRTCLGLLALARRYSAERLEAACTRAMAIRAPTLSSVTNILAAGLNRQACERASAGPVFEHENVCGPGYFHRASTVPPPSRVDRAIPRPRDRATPTPDPRPRPRSFPAPLTDKGPTSPRERYCRPLKPPERDRRQRPPEAAPAPAPAATSAPVRAPAHNRLASSDQSRSTDSSIAAVGRWRWSTRVLSAPQVSGKAAKPATASDRRDEFDP